MPHTSLSQPPLALGSPPSAGCLSSATCVPWRCRRGCCVLPVFLAHGTGLLSLGTLTVGPDHCVGGHPGSHLQCENQKSPVPESKLWFSKCGQGSPVPRESHPRDWPWMQMESQGLVLDSPARKLWLSELSVTCKGLGVLPPHRGSTPVLPVHTADLGWESAVVYRVKIMITVHL